MDLIYVDTPAEAGKKMYGSDVNPFYPGLIFQITGYRLAFAQIDGKVKENAKEKKLFKTNIDAELATSIMTNRYVSKDGKVYRSEGTFSEWFRKTLHDARTKTNDEALTAIVSKLKGVQIKVEGREIVRLSKDGGDYPFTVLDFVFYQSAQQTTPEPQSTPEQSAPAQQTTPEFDSPF